MGLLQLLLMIVFAEAAKQLGGSIECRRRGPATAPQLRGRLAVDQQGAAKHPMLAHQILDRADLFLLAGPLSLLFRGDPA